MLTLKSHFIEMARNNLWSNHRIIKACKTLSEQEYLEKRKSFFGSIHATLSHILNVDRDYIELITKEEFKSLDLQLPYSNINELSLIQHKLDMELLKICNNLSVDQLSSDVIFKNSTGQEFREILSKVLTHLFMHQIHHRGQVHDMLSQTSIDPPQLDEFFLGFDSYLIKNDLAELGL